MTHESAGTAHDLTLEFASNNLYSCTGHGSGTTISTATGQAGRRPGRAGPTTFEAGGRSITNGGKRGRGSDRRARGGPGPTCLDRRFGERYPAVALGRPAGPDRDLGPGDKERWVFGHDIPAQVHPHAACGGRGRDRRGLVQRFRPSDLHDAAPGGSSACPQPRLSALRPLSVRPTLGEHEGRLAAPGRPMPELRIPVPGQLEGRLRRHLGQGAAAAGFRASAGAFSPCA